jgi:hypothetical protein
LLVGGVAGHSHFTISAAILALIELFSALFVAFSLGWHHARSNRSVV